MRKPGAIRLIAGLAAALATAMPGFAQADRGHHRGHGHHHGGYHGYHGGYHHGGRGWPIALAGGLAAGYVIVNSNRYYYTPPPRGYVVPTVPDPRSCRTVYRIEMVDGYEAKTGATMCQDERGIAYIVRGSEFPVDERVVYERQDIQRTLETDCRMTLRGVWFDFDKATLKPESDRALEEVLELLKVNDDFTLEIQGHTDSVGTDAYNMRLSQDRADAVVDWLIQNGADEGRLSARGYGESMPVADNGTDAGRAENRRVELVNPQCNGQGPDDDGPGPEDAE